MTIRTLTLPLFVLLALGTATGCENELPGEGDELLETAELVNPSGEEQALTMPACGTILAEFDGTAARSNGRYTGTGTGCAGQGGLAGGLQYQCVELVMRHFKRKWNLRWYGNARDLLRRAPRDRVDVYDNGDRAHPPVPGDMLVWENGRFGHTALVTRVGADFVDVIEQNVNGNGKARLSFAGGRVGPRWNGWAPTGWAHARANTAPDTAPDTAPAATDVPPGCQRIGVAGRAIDDDDACLTLGGNPDWLRAVDGEGANGDLVWTHATAASRADNRATWALDVARAGTYRVDAFIDDDVATARQARYRVRHAGVVDDVVLDQSARGGWRTLGAWSFARGGDQRVVLGDNTGEAASLERKVVFDALRLVPACATLQVITDDDLPLNVRASASTGATRVGSLPSGSTAERLGTVDGAVVEGTTIWHEVRQGGVRGFVAGAYVGCP